MAYFTFGVTSPVIIVSPHFSKSPHLVKVSKSSNERDNFDLSFFVCGQTFTFASDSIIRRSGEFACLLQLSVSLQGVTFDYSLESLQLQKTQSGENSG